MHQRMNERRERHRANLGTPQPVGCFRLIGGYLAAVAVMMACIAATLWFLGSIGIEVKDSGNSRQECADSWYNPASC